MHKDIWLGKAVKFLLRKVTPLQVIINLYFGKQNEQICLCDSERTLANYQDTEELAACTFFGCFSEIYLFLLKEKEKSK